MLRCSLLLFTAVAITAVGSRAAIIAPTGIDCFIRNGREHLFLHRWTVHQHQTRLGPRCRADRSNTIGSISGNWAASVVNSGPVHTPFIEGLGGADIPPFRIWYFVTWGRSYSTRKRLSMFSSRAPHLPLRRWI